VVTALGVGLGIGVAHGAIAQAPQNATVFAMDQPFRYQVFGAPDGTTDVTIAAGGSVAFGYQEGNSRHNVHFESAQPTSCARFDSSDTVPPLPSSPRPANWSGSCTFATPGTYAYFCDQHPLVMHGTVTVVASEPTPAPTTGPTPPAPSAPDPGASPPPSSPPPPSTAAPAPTTPAPPADVTSPPATGALPPAGGAPSTPTAPLAAAAAGLRVAALPRVARVRGSVDVARPGSRLSVTLFVRRSALGRRGSGLVATARLARARVPAGRISFALRLDTSARRALARRGRLAVTVRIVVSPVAGPPFSATRRVTLRAARR
jgi:plastocyanin